MILDICLGIETNKIGGDYVDFCLDNRKRYVNTPKRYAHAKEWLNKSAHGHVIHLSDHLKRNICRVFFVGDFGVGIKQGSCSR